MASGNSSENRKEGVNEGTKVKATLQLRAIDFMSTYDSISTLEIYAELLCWDLHTTKRTALDSYILPMLRHGYFINVGDNKYSFIGNGKGNKKIKKDRITTETKEEKEEFMDYAKRKQVEKEEKEKKVD